jgi:hypothetical protein
VEPNSFILGVLFCIQHVIPLLFFSIVMPSDSSPFWGKKPLEGTCKKQLGGEIFEEGCGNF